MQLILLLFCLAVIAYPVQAEYLQGGVEHRDYLPAMPEHLKPGNAYEDTQPAPPSIVWYALPKWLAGKYKSDFITNQVIQVYSSAAPQHRSYGRLEHVDFFGVQLDATGRVWHAAIVPRSSTWEGTQKELQTTIQQECVISNDEKLVLHIHNHCLYIDPAKQRIIYANQVDGYKTITLQNTAGDLLVYDDIQEYDRSGKPLDRYIARSTLHRIEEFKPIASENGVDLQASLAQYLFSIGRPDLVAGGSETVKQQEPESTSVIRRKQTDPTEVQF